MSYSSSRLQGSILPAGHWGSEAHTFLLCLLCGNSTVGCAATPHIKRGVIIVAVGPGLGTMAE